MTLQATFAATGHVPPGQVVHLSFAQFDARRHLLAPVKDEHKHPRDNRRLAYTAAGQLEFKAGEEIGIDGVVDRPLQAVLDSVDDAALVAAKAARPGVVKSVTSAQKGQLTRARNKVAAAAADVAEAERALAAGPEAKKEALGKKLAKANAAHDDAREALAGLEQRYGVAG